MPASPSPKNATLTGLAIFAIVATSAILFCSKGVVAKLAYAHGADALTVLALRMGFALPCFAVIAALTSFGAPPLGAGDWARLAGLGFIGYYVSSLVNFIGLQYVSVGLERILLFTYPSMVLVISAFVLRRAVSPRTWVACGIAWLGIAAAFLGETHAPVANPHTGLGTALILLSALTYAVFLLLSGGMIRRVGALRFTALAVGFSCLFMLGHAALTPTTRSALLHLPPAVYGYGLTLAVLGTVVPSLLLGIGLRRSTPQRVAIISSLGPVTTLLLAWAVLGEKPNLAQVAGFALTLGGGLFTSLRPDPVSETAVPVRASPRGGESPAA